MKNFIEGIGRSIIKGLATFVDVMDLLLQTLYWITVGPFKKKFISRQDLFDQMVFIGVRSIPIVFFVAFFTGVVLAMQSAYQLSKMGGTVYVAALVSISLARELGPVLTALVVAGRVGAAITAQLGSMKVSEQIEALDTMAIHPVRFLVAPRFLSLLIMLPVLTAYADLVGSFGGYVVGVLNLKISSGLYIDTAINFLELKDIYTGLFKSVIFAVVIAMISCYQGLSTSGGAEGVGRSTTVSVVTSFIGVIFADCILTGAFYFGNM